MSGDNHDSRSSDDTAIKKIIRNHWTRDEDERLKDYVKTCGEGNWQIVEKHMGLGRTGKSCRLRWVNHLGPNLKKGAFTKEEEQIVINFHVFWENSWARIAKELPGRTNDNVKNFWNTRVRRLQKRGLPIYQMEGTEQCVLNKDSLDQAMTAASSYAPNQAREQASIAASQYVFNNNAYHSQDSLVANQNVPINHGSSSYDQNQAMNATAQYGSNNNVPVNQSSSYYQSVPCNVPTIGKCFSQPNTNNLIASPNFTEPETTFPFSGGYAMNEQCPPPLWNYSSDESTPQQCHLIGNAPYDSTFGTLTNGAENFNHLSSLQCLNSHEEPSSYGVAQSTPMSSLDTNKTWIISDFPPPLGEGSLETSFYGSNTNIKSPLFQSSSLGHAEITPTGTNTTDYACCYMTPSADSPDEGSIALEFHMPPICSPTVRPERPAEAAPVISKRLSDTILSSGMIDLKELCLVSGKAAWMGYLDIYCLNADGALFDAALLSAVAAFSNLHIPVVALSDNGRIVAITGEEGKGHALDKEAVNKEKRKLTLKNIPFSLTCILHKNYILADPTNEEESIMDSLLTVVLDSSDQMVSFYKSGGTALAYSPAIKSCVELARKRANELKQILGEMDID